MAGAQDPKTAGLADGGDQLRRGCRTHPAEHERVPDAEQIAERSVQHGWTSFYSSDRADERRQQARREVEEKPEDPHDKHDEPGEERLVPDRAGTGIERVAPEELQVPGIGLEREVEQVT